MGRLTFGVAGEGGGLMQFGKYDVVGQVGVGSTGVVWLATDSGVGRQVAIKQLAPELAGDGGFRDRFRGEARLLASLSSSNVVAVYDYVEDSDGAYLVEEWVDGSSLVRVVEAAGRLTPAQALGVLRGALRGLATAHEAGLVHGDVTPGNVLVAPDGTSKLIDFGLSVPSGSKGSSGTPGYSSPEAVDGAPLDARSDVYSAGCVLFELLAGHAPYRGDTPDAIAAQQIAAEVPRVPGVHAGLAELVARAMAKDPANRPRDAREFLRELEEEADRGLGLGWDAAASVASLAIAATVTTAAVGAAGGAGAATSAGTTHVVTTAARHGLRRIPKKWAIAGGVTAGAAAVAIVAVAALGGGSSPGPSTAGTVPPGTGDPAKDAQLRRQGGTSGGQSRTSGASVGHFAITVSGDRSASFVGTGTCSLSDQPGATAGYTMERGSDVFSVTGPSRWYIKAILGDSGVLINQGEEGGTLTFSKDQRKVTANVDVTQQVVSSDSSVRPVRTRVTGTITCTP